MATTTPNEPRSNRKGCLLATVLLAGIISLVVVANAGLLTAARSAASGPSGKLLGASVVEDAQGRAVLWMLVDEGVYVLTTVSRPGYHSTGNRCYLSCHVAVLAIDLKANKILLRDPIEDSGSPGATATLAAVGADVWAVLPATDDRAPIVRHYDGATMALKGTNAGLIASREALAAGLLDAKVAGDSVELSTKDGRQVRVAMASEPISAETKPPLRIVLTAESRANKARLKLYRLAGGAGMDEAELARLTRSLAGVGHEANLPAMQRRLDRLARRRELPRRGRRTQAAQARVARLRSKANKLTGALRQKLLDLADKMEARDNEPAATGDAPIHDKMRGADAPGGLRLESVAGDRVFLEAWVAAQDSEYLFIVHQQTAGKRSGRLLSCVDRHGQVRWTLQPNQLPEAMARHEKKRPFSTATITRWRMHVQRRGDAVMLALKPGDVRVYDVATGAQRFAVAL